MGLGGHSSVTQGGQGKPSCGEDHGRDRQQDQLEQGHRGEPRGGGRGQEENRAKRRGKSYIISFIF